MPQFKIDDMTCKHCEATITKAIQEVDAQAKITIDLNTHKVEIISDKSANLFASSITEAGYTPVAMEN